MTPLFQTTEKVSETVLTAGRGSRTYCAFPSLLDLGDRILCMYKLGTAHMRDEGGIAWITFRKDGTVLAEGDVIPPESGKNYQNVELLHFPDGSLRYFVDIQDPAGGKQRLGLIRGTMNNDTFITETENLQDTAGTLYGYAFDAAEYNGELLLLAMTFPELPYPNARKTVEILSSRDCGATWEDRVTLDTAFGSNLNETSLCLHNGKLFILSRSYPGESYLAEFGDGLTQRKVTMLGEKEQIVAIGRPKFFTHDGELYALFRNHRTADAPMELVIAHVDTNALGFDRCTVLDTGTRDGYYAEPYFDGDDLCVVTYKQPHPDAKPAIVLLRYSWAKLRV